MKKMRLLLCAFMVCGLALTSCGDDDGNAVTEGALEGKWFYAQEGITSNGQEILHDWDHTTGCSKDYVEILTGGVYRDVTFWDECVEEVTTTTWVRNGNTVTAGTGEDAMVLNLVSVTDTTLKVTWNESVGGQTLTYVTVFTRN